MRRNRPIQHFCSCDSNEELDVRCVREWSVTGTHNAPHPSGGRHVRVRAASVTTPTGLRVSLVTGAASRSSPAPAPAPYSQAGGRTSFRTTHSLHRIVFSTTATHKDQQETAPHGVRRRFFSTRAAKSSQLEVKAAPQGGGDTARGAASCSLMGAVHHLETCEDAVRAYGDPKALRQMVQVLQRVVHRLEQERPPCTQQQGRWRFALQHHERVSTTSCVSVPRPFFSFGPWRVCPCSTSASSVQQLSRSIKRRWDDSSTWRSRSRSAAALCTTGSTERAARSASASGVARHASPNLSASTPAAAPLDSERTRERPSGGSVTTGSTCRVPRLRLAPRYPFYSHTQQGRPSREGRSAEACLERTPRSTARTTLEEENEAPLHRGEASPELESSAALPEQRTSSTLSFAVARSPSQLRVAVHAAHKQRPARPRVLPAWRTNVEFSRSPPAHNDSTSASSHVTPVVAPRFSPYPLEDGPDGHPPPPAGDVSPPPRRIQFPLHVSPAPTSAAPSRKTLRLQFGARHPFSSPEVPAVSKRADQTSASSSPSPTAATERVLAESNTQTPYPAPPLKPRGSPSRHAAAQITTTAEATLRWSAVTAPQLQTTGYDGAETPLDFIDLDSKMHGIAAAGQHSSAGIPRNATSATTDTGENSPDANVLPPTSASSSSSSSTPQRGSPRSPAAVTKEGEVEPYFTPAPTPSPPRASDDGCPSSICSRRLLTIELRASTKDLPLETIRTLQQHCDALEQLRRTVALEMGDQSLLRGISEEGGTSPSPSSCGTAVSLRQRRREPVFEHDELHLFDENVLATDTVLILEESDAESRITKRVEEVSCAV